MGLSNSGLWDHRRSIGCDARDWRSRRSARRKKSRTLFLGRSKSAVVRPRRFGNVIMVRLDWNDDYHLVPLPKWAHWDSISSFEAAPS